jgi:hypothetical protein
MQNDEERIWVSGYVGLVGGTDPTESTSAV